ncbi:MAG: formylglycine-generating enzyme family protein [bacterium]|nr:formylglycine-generating enzyme family protein [bacterium]
MKENINIDQLFQKAANTPVHTSFDEAKELFSTSLARRNAKKWKILRAKNLIIMLATLASITLIGILLFGPNSSGPVNKSNGQKSTMAIRKSSTADSNKRKLLNEDGPSLEQLEVMNPRLLDSFIPMKPLRKSLLRFQPKIAELIHYKNDPYRNSHIFDLASDRRDRRDTVEIPTLTEDEIAENEKVKKKMMKALAKRHKDHYAYIPSGSSSYKGTSFSIQAFYMQVNEVSNEQYRTFLNDLLIQGREDEYIKAYPHEHQWVDELSGATDAMFRLYFTHPAYSNYPVVNVTREGAEMYCKWLTLETTQSKYVDDANSLNDVRLPQRLEWAYAASNGDSKYMYPWGGNFTKNSSGAYLANFNPDTSNYSADGGFYTTPTGTYYPNQFGLYNMSGNVAEMVYGPTDFTSKSDLISIQKEPGTAGGGWLDDEDALKIEGDDPYKGRTEGHPNIGFRVVITHLKK